MLVRLISKSFTLCRKPSILALLVARRLDRHALQTSAPQVRHQPATDEIVGPREFSCASTTVPIGHSCYLGHRDLRHTTRYTRTASRRFEGLWR